jgi:hypothetical protein
MSVPPSENRPSTVHRFYITAPGERPDFRLVITFLWHDGQNVDTDGNSYNPASRTWTQLYIQNREQPDQVVDVTPYQESPLILLIESKQQYLAARVAFFLSTFCGGCVSSQADGEYRQPDSLLSHVGVDFGTSAAMERVAQSPFSHSSVDNPFPNLDREGMLRAKAALGL